MLTMPTKSTREYMRKANAVQQQLRAALKAKGITTDKKRKLAILAGKNGRAADLSEKAKLRLAARRAGK